jgi:hypothetical protein
MFFLNGYYYHILPTCLVVYTSDMWGLSLRNMIPIAEAKQRFPEVFDAVGHREKREEQEERGEVVQKLFSDLKI